MIVAGPVLYARGADRTAAHVTVLVVTREGEAAPRVAAAGQEDAMAVAAQLEGHVVWMRDIALPAGDAADYAVNGTSYRVRTDLGGSLRIGFVSCNGQENGDEDREHEHRDVMWRRLLTEHRERPFALLLHGGDQLYADEAVESHPAISAWAKDEPARRAQEPFTPEMEAALRGYFFRRYLDTLTQAAAAPLYATVPSLMIWDDHDIFDGWGSHPDALQQSPIAQGIFRVAREMFILFQVGGVEGSLPRTCLEPSGATMTQSAHFPGFSVCLPDLRSERSPDRVMGPAGWAAFERALADCPHGDAILLVSSVPALGPRLSLVESILDRMPRAQKYEDDLRDQWQSRSHRAEWRRFLTLLEAKAVQGSRPLTVISGEIHLATRAEMRLEDGSTMHQLVASGITHPKPPAAFPLALSLLSRVGESPLRGRPIKVFPLPGRRMPYIADRNYLVVTRRDGRWSAEWELEETGRTPALPL
ncbi:alkaline phosphatase D family protein [Aureimonas altamirensis]|uniref:alkaline phosphatase D family protein n=1 Tax=Aureimonas altamirensis TaxID=370622 RepID=UPI0025562E51|nr:alkaline phosphatase D family protein [Aureimonas altamirensis]